MGAKTCKVRFLSRAQSRERQIPGINALRAEAMTGVSRAIEVNAASLGATGASSPDPGWNAAQAGDVAVPSEWEGRTRGIEERLEALRQKVESISDQSTSVVTILADEVAAERAARTSEVAAERTARCDEVFIVRKMAEEAAAHMGKLEGDLEEVHAVLDKVRGAVVDVVRNDLKRSAQGWEGGTKGLRARVQDLSQAVAEDARVGPAASSEVQAFGSAVTKLSTEIVACAERIEVLTKFDTAPRIAEIQGLTAAVAELRQQLKVERAERCEEVSLLRTVAAGAAARADRLVGSLEEASLEMDKVSGAAGDAMRSDVQRLAPGNEDPGRVPVADTWGVSGGFFQALGRQVSCARMVAEEAAAHAERLSRRLAEVSAAVDEQLDGFGRAVESVCRDVSGASEANSKGLQDMDARLQLLSRMVSEEREVVGLVKERPIPPLPPVSRPVEARTPSSSCTVTPDPCEAG